MRNLETKTQTGMITWLDLDQARFGRVLGWRFMLEATLRSGETAYLLMSGGEAERLPSFLRCGRGIEHLDYLVIGKMIRAETRTAFGIQVIVGLDLIQAPVRALGVCGLPEAAA